MTKKLPKNWSNIDLENAITFVIGGDWGVEPTENLNNDYKDVLCIRGGELKKWRIEKGKSASLRAISADSLEKRQLRKGDILLEISGGGPDQPVGRTVLIDDEVLNFKPELPKITTNFFRLVRINPKINSSYINYYLQSFYNSGQIVNYQGGSNNLRNLKFKEFVKINIPLAPINEQKKIVQKIDKIFSHLDIANEGIQKLPSIIKQFKQNILEQAISGKLTKDWREKNKTININKHEFVNSNKQLHKSKISDTWVSGNISDLFLVNPGHKGITIQDNLHVSFVPMASIEEENGVIHTELHRQYKEVKSGFTKFIEGDVLFAKITPCMENGKVGIATGLKNGLGCGTTELHVFREQVRGTNIILFYHFLLESFRQKAKSNFQGSSGHLRVPVNFFEDFKIDLPPQEEIEQIQKKVIELFKYIENIENHYLELKKVVKSLPNNVLNKAFCGELVKQDPNDESAEILLNKIKEEKNNKKLTPVKTTKRPPKPTNNQENFKQQLETLKGLIRKKLFKIKIDKELSNQYLINIISNESSNQELIYDVMQELIQENAITQIYDKRKKEFYFKINESIKH